MKVLLNNFEKFIKKKFLYNKEKLSLLYLFFNKLKSKFSGINTSYSQGAMDLILQDIFKKKEKWLYIDVGCQHPISNNNTYKLFKKGWHGINIDLDKYNIDIFNYNRPNDYNICDALTDKIEDRDLFFYHEKSPINTLNLNVSKKQISQISHIKKIKTNTLENIFTSSPFCNENIDLLTIDVEGEELSVLKGFNLDLHKPYIIILEFLDLRAKKFELIYNNLDAVLNSEIYIYLISKKYKLINWVNGDLVFIKI